MATPSPYAGMLRRHSDTLGGARSRASLYLLGFLICFMGKVLYINVLWLAVLLCRNLMSTYVAYCTNTLSFVCPRFSQKSLQLTTVDCWSTNATCLVWVIHPPTFYFFCKYTYLVLFLQLYCSIQVRGRIQCTADIPLR